MNTIEHQKADQLTSFKVKQKSIDFILNYSKAYCCTKTRLGVFEHFQN
jgi:hypothetical protein